MEKWLQEKVGQFYPNLSKGSIAKIVSNIYMILPEDPEIWGSVEGNYDHLSLEDSKRIVEGKRSEVDAVRKELEVFRQAVKELAHWKSDRLSESPWISKIPVKKWVTKQCLERIPKKLVDEQEIRENLRKLDLPEAEVLADKRFGKTTYSIPENAEEAAEIRNRFDNVELQRRYRRLLQPIARDVNKDFSVEIEVKDRMPSLARVWYHYRHFDSELPPQVTSTLEWISPSCLLHPQDHHRIESLRALLEIDLCPLF